MHLDVQVPTRRSTIDVFRRVINFFFFWRYTEVCFVLICTIRTLEIHGGWRMAVYRGN